jgi:Icc-related predicted phosphoesterase
MKIIVISDIHGRKGNLSSLPSAKLYLLCGDIAQFGAGNEAGEVLSQIKGKVWSVLGNCDDEQVLEYLEKNDMSLHRREREFCGLRIFGVGGGKRATGTTPTEFTEEQFAAMLPVKRVDILVTHSPPRDCLDTAMFGMHAGSTAIRKYIETYQPSFAFCGHVHEARGQEHIGTTTVVNPIGC